MSDTLHIKRFDEYGRSDGGEVLHDWYVGSMLNDLAHHLEQEHERNNHLEAHLDRLERVVARLDKRVEMYRTDIIKLVSSKGITDLPLPKGENN